ncbi:MAG: S8 family serine peptidase [Lachnospiraceae bacterium]|nr:S8 family serine peptidase [Lachnospiraceae bacterium]
MQKSISIAIIDNGINEILLRKPLKNSVYVNEQFYCQKDVNNYEKELFDHGSKCALIIEEFCPRCELVSVKILGNNGKGLINKLKPALEWCIQEKIRLINLSLGTIHFSDKTKIQRIINEYSNRGIIIIAATSNTGYITYPASFSNVIGVACGENFVHDMTMKFERGIDFVVSTNYKIKNIHSNLKIENTNSYAAPYITALAGNLLSENNELNFLELKRKIYEIYNDKSKDFFYCSEPDWISQAYFKDGNNNSKLEFYFTEIKTNNGKQEKSDTIILMSQKNLNNYELENKNIVYLGKEKFKYRNFNKFFWSREQKSLQITNTQIRKGEIEIPVILCLLKGKIDCFFFLSEIRKNFKNDSYNLYTVSMKEQSVLYNFEYIPKEYLQKEKKNKLLDFLYWQTYFKKSDAILICIDKTIKKNKEYNNINFDVIMELSLLKKESNVLVSLNKNNQKFICEQLDQSTILTIYQKLLDQLIGYEDE